MLNVRAALPSEHAGIPQEKVLYGSLFMLRCMFLTRLMPAYVCLKGICVEALRLLFPNLLKDSLHHVLQNKRLFPGEGSKHKMRLAMDVAMLLWKRKQETKHGEYVRFSGADSSPQHGQNWLLSSSLTVPAKNMIEVFRAIQRLIEERERRDLNQGSEFEVELQSEQSRADHAYLLATVRPQHDIPVVLGSGAESTGHKVAAMLHKFALLVGHTHGIHLQQYCDSFFSFCSDMGAELGITHFHVSDLWSLLPSWMQHEPMQLDLPEGCVLPDVAAPPSPAPDLSPADFVMDVQGPNEELPQRAPAVSAVALPHEEPQQAEIRGSDAWPPPASATDVLFLRHAMSVPGLLRVVNNALCEVSSKLSYFDVFFEQLGEFEGLVTCGRLLRFVNSCVKPSQLASQADELLQRKFGRLYLKRWGEVVNFCRRLALFLPLIRCVWNEQAYARGEAGAQVNNADEGGAGRADTRFRPERFTSILKDQMFFAYFDMVLELSNAIEQLSHWVESCPCHSDLQLPIGLQRF